MKKLTFIWAFTASLLFSNAGYANSDQHHSEPVIDNAWIREAPPVVKVLAGFMSISNPADKTVVLTGAESPLFEKIELHRSILENGMARMERQKQVEIPAGGKLEFSPGGLHLMLVNPKQPLKAGDTVEIIVKFERGRSSPVVFTVRSMDNAEHHHHHH